ncbi:hypothetical protein ANN_19066 [Periplaneta americana]|uniref:PiggyBac transposable element-derived protein domain-containing protein n=1 Tax=Periplaneta americana TaxID=6978 RepID=A0ABQ8SR12_PERAM|nr:hypothetical protein ANN_19066 [Periplaneta americana]
MQTDTILNYEYKSKQGRQGKQEENKRSMGKQAEQGYGKKNKQGDDKENKRKRLNFPTVYDRLSAVSTCQKERGSQPIEFRRNKIKAHRTAHVNENKSNIARLISRTVLYLTTPIHAIMTSVLVVELGQKRRELLNSQKFLAQPSYSTNEKATEASFIVSYRVAQAGESHKIAEKLIKPCAIDMVKWEVNEKEAKQLSSMPLSNDTVARRIQDMEADVKEDLNRRLRSCQFALEIDESSDVADLAVVLLFVLAPREAGLVVAREEDSSAFLQQEPAITTGPAQEPEASTLAERELEVCAVGDREPEIFQTYTGNGESVYGKNRYKWFTAPFHSSRTRQHNIVRVKLPQLRGAARTIHSNEPIDFWKLLFDDKILNLIVTNTNEKITELSANYGKTASFTNHIDIVELNAFLGLLYLSGVFKSGNEDAKGLWNADDTGRDIFRATMSLDQFLFLLIAIRFDDPAERELRK